ncbi:MAG: glycosyl transferase [Planctomycetota bacterium]|nr:MAG: glycosyl transferase [Planctomycetota bacterium]
MRAMSASASRSQLPLAAPPGSVCLLRLSAIGDVCHTVPVVRTLQAVWPQTRLTWIIGRLEAELVGDLPGVEFIVYDKAGGVRAWWELQRRLRRRRFEVLLHMQAALRANLVALCVRAPLRLGFDRARARDLQWLCTNARIAASPRAHVIDGLFAFLQALGVRERVLRWEIPIPEAARARARRWLGPPEADGGPPLLVISPCASERWNNFRDWPPERYAAVAEHAARSYGARVVLTGGPSARERRAAARIGAAAPGIELVDLVGRTGLKELLAILERARALVAPDSGPLHLADALGVPAIGLFATSNPQRTGPVRDARWIVNRYPDAVRAAFGREVEEIRWGRRVRDPAAMDRVTVADVIERLDAVFARAPRPGPLAPSTAPGPGGPGLQRTTPAVSGQAHAGTGHGEP